MSKKYIVAWSYNTVKCVNCGHAPSPVSRAAIHHQWALVTSPIGSSPCWVFQSLCWELFMLLSVHDLRLGSSGPLYHQQLFLKLYNYTLHVTVVNKFLPVISACD